MCIQSWPSDPEILSVVCQIFESSLNCLQFQMIQLLPSICGTIMPCFDHTQLPCCIDVLAAIVSIFRENLESIIPNFSKSVTALYATIMRTSSMDKPEVMKSYFSFCQQMFSVCLAALQPSIGDLLVLSAHCFRSQDRDCLKKVTEFCSSLFDHPKDQQYSAYLDSILIKTGELLTRAILFAISDTAPQFIVGRMAFLLYTLFKRYGEAFRRWVYTALSNNSFPSKRLGPEGKQLFLDVLWSFWGMNNKSISQQEKDKRKRRFKAMMLDFCAICRAQNEYTCLLAYRLEQKNEIL